MMYDSESAVKTYGCGDFLWWVDRFDETSGGFWGAMFNVVPRWLSIAVTVVSSGPEVSVVVSGHRHGLASDSFFVKTSDLRREKQAANVEANLRNQGEETPKLLANEKRDV
jgi:hypothetical protein